jgi:hypothetical protein
MRNLEHDQRLEHGPRIMRGDELARGKPDWTAPKQDGLALVRTPRGHWLTVVHGIVADDWWRSSRSTASRRARHPMTPVRRRPHGARHRRRLEHAASGRDVAARTVCREGSRAARRGTPQRDVTNQETPGAAGEGAARGNRKGAVRISAGGHTRTRDWRR